LSSTPEFTENQLASARIKAWHQDGTPIITLEGARDWLNGLGVVLFAPKAQIAAPAPSLVEATLGEANPAPTLAQSEIARGLVSRLVADGVALPLNLLGVPGDVPDYVVSAQVFSYVFTLRGDKAWKLPPSTSGAISVSPLGLKVYEALTAKGAMSAAELALELGREVTEAAILRSLVELWSQLRVLPLLAQGSGTTMWELATRRFTKAIKAGANAGQPTALSALISLYLAQALAATEDEIETFLSPLTARSRVREVLHALTGGRQLETVVLEGKTLLHIPGALPEFATEKAEVFVSPDGEAVVMETPAEKPKKVGTGRIGKFASEGKTAGELRGKAVKQFGVGPGLVKPSARFGARADGRSEPARRPFKKDAAGDSKPTFTKPRGEGKKPAGKPVGGKFGKPVTRKPLGDREQAGLPPEKRVFSKSKYEREATARDTARAEAKLNMGASEGGEGAPWKKPRSYERPEGKPAFGAKKPYAPRAANGERSVSKPAFSSKPAFGRKPVFGSKPSFGDKKPGGFGAKRPYTPRDAEGGERPSRPAFGSKPAFGAKPSLGSRPSFGDKKPGSLGAKRPSAPRGEGEGTTYPKRPYTPRGEGASSTYPKRPYTPRTTEGGESTYPKRSYIPRSAEGGDRGDFKPRSFSGGRGGSKSGGFGRRASFTPVDENAPRALPKRPYKPRAADADQRTFTKAPWTPEESAPKKSFKSRPSGKPRFGGRPGTKPGGFTKRPRSAAGE
jgi:hypothetical protein